MLIFQPVKTALYSFRFFVRVKASAALFYCSARVFTVDWVGSLTVYRTGWLHNETLTGWISTLLLCLYGSTPTSVNLITFWILGTLTLIQSNLTLTGVENEAAQWCSG